MDESWLFRINAAVLAADLAGAMLLAAWAGHGLARRQPADRRVSLTAIETGLFGLLGLLLAFTFSGAASRYDARGQLMMDSANALRGAILRADFFPAETRAALRADLREFLAAQVVFHRHEHEAVTRAVAIERSDTVQQRLWAHVAEASKTHEFASGQMANALDRLFSATASRHLAARVHMPETILGLLFVLALATAFTSSYGGGAGKRFSTLGYAGFSVLTALVIYVTLDLDRPGKGLIRRDLQEQEIESLQQLLREPGPRQA